MQYFVNIIYMRSILRTKFDMKLPTAADFQKVFEKITKQT